MNNVTCYIYGVSGVFNHCLYIGSTACIDRREKEHLSALEAGRHFNEFLQAAHDCFGQDNLRMVVLEKVKEDDDRKQREEKWIAEKSKDAGVVVCNKKLSGGNLKSGYKLSDATRQRQSKAKTQRSIEKTRAKLYHFVSPYGVEIESLGLKALCDKHDLNIGHLSRVARGDLMQHKGWKRAKDF
jgi:predicted GIY-YIG superfamily endonuclease